jgi:hypothetical protein
MPSSVLIVVNSSELEHLSYADPRPALIAEGIEDVTLIIASDVDGITRHLLDSRTKVLVFASNSLRDPQLHGALSGELGAHVERHLDRGGGLLCLHQLRRTHELEWLPPALFGSEIILAPRPRTERGSQGRAEMTGDGRVHPILNFPASIDISALNRNAAESGPSGLYWHSIELKEPEKWSVLVSDAEHNARALIVERRFLLAGRVVFCSIQLDRIRSTQLLSNLIRYLRDGPYRIGMVRHMDDNSLALDELWQTLSRQSTAAYVHELHMPADTAPLRWAIASGMHSSLVLAPGCHTTQLPGAVTESLIEEVRRGRLRVLEIGDASGYGDDFCFTVVSRERDSIAMVRSAVSRMRLAIATGLADGSLWATYEGLSCLEDLDDGWTSSADDLGPVLKDADRRDIGGSYDETFVATAALAWIRSRVHGPKAAGVRACVTWLRSRQHRESPADTFRVATMLSYAGALPNSWRISVAEALDVHAKKTDELFELDLLACLNCALAIGSSTAEVLAAALAARVRRGTWIEISTTADCVSALVRVLATGVGDQRGTVIREAALVGARYLHERLANVGDMTAVSCATHARAAAALYRFDQIVGVSVGALVDAVIGAVEEGTSRDTAQSYNEAMKSARDAIQFSESRRVAAENRYRTAARLARWHKVAIAAACYAVYLAGAVVVAVANEARPGLAPAWHSLTGNIEVHVGLLLAITGPLVAWIRRGWRTK